MQLITQMLKFRVSEIVYMPRIVHTINNPGLKPGVDVRIEKGALALTEIKSGVRLKPLIFQSFL
jgi:hypothetical protein